jgi:hypothetical protein
MPDKPALLTPPQVSELRAIAAQERQWTPGAIPTVTLREASFRAIVATLDVLESALRLISETHILPPNEQDLVDKALDVFPEGDPHA